MKTHTIKSVGKLIPSSTPMLGPEPFASTSHTVNGGGEICSKNGSIRATFGFSIQYNEGDSAPSGSLTFQDRIAFLRLKATIFNMLVVEDSLAWFSGTGILEDGKAVKFAVEVNTSPDRFYIYIPALGEWVAGGKLAGGNVTIQ